SRITRPMTASRPLVARISSRSPMRFMAAESRTSPVLDASTSVAMAIQSLNELMLLLGGRQCMRVAPPGERWSARHQAYTAGDKQNAGPAPRADRFMQKNAREKSRDHITQGGRGQDVGEVGPGERGQVGVKKTGEEDNAEDDPGIEEGVED